MSRLGFVAAALFAAQAFGVGSAFGQEGFVWSYDRQLDPDPFQTRLTLAYAIPETDAIQLVATCQIGANRTYAVFEIGADIGAAANGSPVDVRFVGENFSHVLSGEVVGVGAEVGITGASIAVELDDPLWLALRALPELRYGVVNPTDHQLLLEGSSGPVAEFLADCTDIPEPEQPVVATPEPPPPGSPAATSCEAIDSLKTTGGGAPATVTFVNQADGFRSVMWIDGDGIPQQYGNLNPGQAYVQSTFVGHVWMITDGPGNCLEVYVPPAGATTFVITAPNVNFGPE